MTTSVATHTAPLLFQRLLQPPGRCVVGFSGSRNPDDQTWEAMRLAAETLLYMTDSPHLERLLRVGDAAGVDALIRSVCEMFGKETTHLQVYDRDVGSGSMHAALIARSIKLAVDLSREPAALLIAGPAKTCPWSIQPTGIWIAGKNQLRQKETSGTWSTIGVAVGLGVPCLVYLPLPIMPPNHGRWNWQPTGIDGWWEHAGVH